MKLILIAVTALAMGVLSNALADDHYAAQNGQTPSVPYTGLGFGPPAVSRTR